MENENLLLYSHIESAEILGFWDEGYKSTLIKSVESTYNVDIIKYWSIVDLVLNGDKFLIKWKKRFRELSKEELKEQYGKS